MKIKFLEELAGIVTLEKKTNKTHERNMEKWTNWHFRGQIGKENIPNSLNEVKGLIAIKDQRKKVLIRNIHFVIFKYSNTYN